MRWSRSVKHFRSLDTAKGVAGLTERIMNKRVYFCFLKFRNRSHGEGTLTLDTVRAQRDVWL